MGQQAAAAEQARGQAGKPPLADWMKTEHRQGPPGKTHRQSACSGNSGTKPQMTTSTSIAEAGVSPQGLP